MSCSYTCLREIQEGGPITHMICLDVYLRGSWGYELSVSLSDGGLGVGGGFQCVASPHTNKLNS